MKPLSILLTLIGMTASAHAATILAAGTSITGATTSLNLSISTGDSRPAGSNATLTNSGGNLLFTPSNAGADYSVQWNGLSINSNDFRYVQVTFSAITAGAVSSRWQTFFADGDSTIGSPSSSGHTIGSVTLGTIPLVVVIDMTALSSDGNGGTTGARGWGAADPASDTVTALRLDMFEDAANSGKTFTISSVVLGNSVIPEPSTALLGGLGLLALLRRRR